MALQFNSLIKGANGIMLSMVNNPFNGQFDTLYIYPSTIAYPSTCPTSVTAGSILTYTSLGTSWVQTGSTINLSGSKTATASAAGTLSWWLLVKNSTPTSYSFCGDSISAPGGGGVCIVNTLTPTLSATVTLSSFSITLS